MLTYSMLRNLSARTDGTASTSAALVSPPAGLRYTNVVIHNHDAANPLWVDIVQRGASAPTVSSTQKTFVVNPSQTLVLNISESVSVYVAAAVSVAYSARFASN